MYMASPAVDVLAGLELHCNVLSPGEQAQLVEAVEHWVALVRGWARGRCTRDSTSLAGGARPRACTHRDQGNAPMGPPACGAPSVPLPGCCLLPLSLAWLASLLARAAVQGKSGHLRGRTFSAPKKWLPGKGRVTMQFGCCYNYAADAQGRPPGKPPRGGRKEMGQAWLAPPRGCSMPGSPQPQNCSPLVGACGSAWHQPEIPAAARSDLHDGEHVLVSRRALNVPPGPCSSGTAVLTRLPAIVAASLPQASFRRRWWSRCRRSCARCAAA